MQSPTVNDMNGVIDHLAAKLSIPASHLWAVLLRQQMVDVAQCVITVVIVGIIDFCLIRAWKKHRDDYGAEVYFCVGGIFVVVATIVVLIWLINATGELVNPEYYALHDILSAFKS